jgi:Icc-related predicted phosphoesterase
VADEQGVHALVLVGDLGGGTNRRESYRAIFGALANARIPAYWVPGAGDAPVEDYLREAQNIEVAHPMLRGVHGTAAFAPGFHLVIAGLGGEISDDPDARRDEVERLHYPRWEVEYRLKILTELGEHERMLVFATPPAHKGRGTAGSDVVAELINTHRPRVAVCGGPRDTQMQGRTRVVSPGSLAEGQFAIADLRHREAEMGELATA